MVSKQLEDLVEDGVNSIDFEKVGVYAIITVTASGLTSQVVGAVRSFLVDSKPEVEMRASIDDAMFVAMRRDTLICTNAEIQRGDQHIVLTTKARIAAVRVDEIDVVSQLCLLSVQLQPDS